MRYTLVGCCPGAGAPCTLLCYGVLAGGFLSDRWLGAPDPGLALERHQHVLGPAQAWHSGDASSLRWPAGHGPVGSWLGFGPASEHGMPSMGWLHTPQPEPSEATSKVQ